MTQSTKAYVLVAAVLAISAVISLLHIRNSYFEQDELQHMHLAWNVANGKVPYADFYDQHTPLSFMLNGLILRVLGIPETVDTIFMFRYFSIVLIAVYLACVYKICLLMTDSRRAGAFACMTVAASFIFQDKSTEVRPDLLQNILFMGGLYLTLKFQDRNSCLKLFLAGVMLGTSLAVNSKIVVGVTAIFCGWLFLAIVGAQSRSDTVKQFWSTGLGITLVWTLLSLYFYSSSALREFIYYGFIFNVQLILEGTRDKYYFAYFLTREPGWIWLFIGSLLWFLAASLKGRTLEGLLGWIRCERQLVMLLLVTGIVSLASLASGLYSQVFLTPLPLVAILYVIVMIRQGANGGCIHSSAVRMIYRVGFYAATASLLAFSIYKVPTSRDAHLEKQIDFTEFVLGSFERDQKILSIWNIFGGNVFNADAFYYLHSPLPVAKLHNKVLGFDIYGEYLVSILEKDKTEALVLSDYELETTIPLATREYFSKHYVRCADSKGLRKYLWTRKADSSDQAELSPNG